MNNDDISFTSSSCVDSPRMICTTSDGSESPEELQRQLEFKLKMEKYEKTRWIRDALGFILVLWEAMLLIVIAFGIPILIGYLLFGIVW